MGNDEGINYNYLNTFGYLDQVDELMGPSCYNGRHRTRSRSRSRRRNLELYNADRIEQQDEIDFQQELEELNAEYPNAYYMASCGCPKKKKKRSAKKGCGKKKPKKRKSKGSCGKKRKPKKKKSKGCKKPKRKPKKAACPPDPCAKPKKKRRRRKPKCPPKPDPCAPKCSDGAARTNQLHKFDEYNYLQQFQSF